MKERQFITSQAALPRAWMLFAIAALLVGCSGATAPVAAPSAAPAARQLATLTYAFPDDSASTLAAEKLIKAYIATNPSVKITAQPLPAQDYPQQLLGRIGSGAPDLFVSTDMQMPGLIKRNAVLDLQPFLLDEPKLKVDDLQPTALAAWRRGSALYGLPVDVVPQVLFYNQELFDANSVPHPAAGWTWDNWLADAKNLTVSENGQVSRYGTALGTWGAMVWGNGGELVNADGTRSLLDSPEAAAGVQFAADMVNVHKVAPPPPNANGPDPLALFKDQHVAMLPAPSSIASSLLAAKLPFKWAIAPLPTGRVPAVPLSVSGLAIHAQSQNKQAALDFATWMAGPDGTAVKADLLPFAAPALQSAAARPSQVPGDDAIRQTLQHGRTLPQVEQWPKIKALVDEALVPVWQGKQPAAAIYRQLTSSINALLNDT
jgi:multiple sugar transport system substrate-binding protein